MADVVGTPSGLKTASATILAVPGRIYSITIRLGTSAAQTAWNLRDGGAGGTIIHTISKLGGVALGDDSVHQTFPKGMVFGTDIYAENINGNGHFFCTFARG